jgi:hypothetical protein
MGGMTEESFFKTFRGALIFVAGIELNAVAAVWNENSPVLAATYAMLGFVFALLLIRSRRINTKATYNKVGQTAFGLFVFETIFNLIRLR